MQYRYWIYKRNVEHIFLYPFILLGKILCALRKPKKQSYDCYFFFPFYHTGGAEYVHAQIVQAVQHTLKGKIFFTRKSNNDQFKKVFEESGWDTEDISHYTDHKLWYFTNLILRGYLAHLINQNSHTKFVFNGQSNFGYKISPWIKDTIPQYELIHSYNSFSAIRIPYIEYYTKTVMIAAVRIEDHIRQYRRLNIPKEYESKIVLIQNGIKIPTQRNAQSSQRQNLKVLYVGRGSIEKRVYLVEEIAAKLKDQPISFGLVGDIEPSQTVQHENIRYYGNVDAQQLQDIYPAYDLLIITSITEGMPIVVQEAMSQGLAIICTPVGDLPLEIENGVNGFVLSSYLDESTIVEESIQKILEWESNRKLVQEIGKNNQKKANQKYSLTLFQKKYDRLFNLSSTD